MNVTSDSLRRFTWPAAVLSILLTAGSIGCSGNKSDESNQSTATGDTTVMGIQGDTTSNDLDGPVAAPSDTVTGQTLPQADVKKKE